MKKILLYGFFGHKNLGDDMLLSEALQHYPDDYQLSVYWPQSAKDELKRFQTIRSFIPVYGRKEVLKHSYRAIVYAGGGQFPVQSFGLKNFLNILLFRIRCRKLLMHGIGIVPKSKRFFFDLALRLVDYCSVRDDVSLQFIKPVSPSSLNVGDLYWGNTNPVVPGGGK